MWISFIKFFHLLLALGLLSATFFCFMLASNARFTHLTITLNRLLLWCSVLVILTGTLLIYPKHFTFHTPWIQAAYVLTFIFGISLSFLARAHRKAPTGSQRWKTILYGMFIILFIIIIHDAVTKTTFLIK